MRFTLDENRSAFVRPYNRQETVIECVGWYDNSSDNPNTPSNPPREVQRHIGDFTLFWTGVYPEALPKLRASLRKDHLIDYVQQGKQSYRLVSLFDIGEWREEAPMFRRLSENFEIAMQGLYAVRQMWEQMAQESFTQFRRQVEGF